MARYFFHVLNKSAIIDHVGEDLPGLVEARAMAIRTAGEILASEGDAFWNQGKWRMAVADASGKIWLTLDFSAHAIDEAAETPAPGG
jgi:hypothetical protein